jgi:hypothetical protein
MRTKGSCRFTAYYKVQFFDDKNLTWKDVQKAHPSEKDARANFISGKTCRVMEVSEAGRRIL